MALRAAIVYIAVQLLLRVVGRKELGRYSTFDIAVLFLVATAARRTMTGDDDSITTALVALATIFGLEALLSYLSFRSERFARLVQGPPRTLVEDGRVNERNMRRAHISREDLLAHLRLRGIDAIEDVKSASLERSGRVSVVRRERP